MACSGVCRATVGRYGTGRWRKPCLRPQSPPPVATDVGEQDEKDLVFNNLLSAYDVSGRGASVVGARPGTSAGPPFVRWEKKVRCASLALPSAKQVQPKPTSQYARYRCRQVFYTFTRLVTLSVCTKSHSYLCDHEHLKGQSLPYCFIFDGGDRLGKGIPVSRDIATMTL